MRQQYSHWTQEETQSLKSLKEGGKSARQIGEILNKSRNSVIGRLNRMGLSTKNNHVPRGPRKEASIVMRRLPMPKLEKPDESLKVLMADLEWHHCRWPIGDPKEVGFGLCGHHRMKGDTAYCEYHFRLGRTVK